MNFRGVDHREEVIIEVFKSSQKRKEMFKKQEELESKENYNEANKVQKILHNIVGLENEDELSEEE